MSTQIRVLLADDHESVRQGLRALFATSADVNLVGDVNDGAEAVAMTKELAPDVVVMDLSMPTSGLVALRQIKSERPATAVVVLTRHRDSAFVRAAIAGGAHGYVLKQSPFSEVTSAVRAAARGERYIDQHLGDALPPARVDRAGAASSQLSPREMEVLRRTGAGHANKDVASELGISVKTVEAHKANAMRKLRLEDRAAVVRFAMMQGWLDE
jgi:DNA-binding NarL/FixJ family response regulator